MHKLSLSISRCAALLAIGAAVLPAQAGISHRYSFTTDVTDSVGGANGAAVQRSDGGVPLGGPVVFDAGQALLDGVGGYIDLPNGLISTNSSITFEAWVTVNAVANWCRIFDFGTSTSGDTAPDQAIGTGLRYMFLTPSVGTSGTGRFAITDDSNGAERPVLNDTEPFPIGVETHVAVTYGGGVAKLYVNGTLRSSGAAPVPLSALTDNNNWLGRSQWNDSLLNGSYNEVRIHDEVLSGLAIKSSSLGNADTVGYDPGTISAITVTGEATMAFGAVQTPTVIGTFSVAGETQITPPDVTLTSSDPAKVSVDALGQLKALNVGSVTITAARGGQSATFTVTVTPASAPELKHRYSFNEAAGATEVVDSVSAANGSAFGGVSGTNEVLFGTGSAIFPAAPGYQESTYIALPPGLISSKTNITIETWVSWAGAAGQSWQRIFDFGASTKGSDAHVNGAPAAAHGYMFLTARSGAAPNVPRFAVKTPGGGENPVLSAAAALPLNTQTHFVIVYAPQYGVSRMFVNGIPVATGTAPLALNLMTDANNWLGVAQFNDPPFNGSINEFRIYEGALTDLEVSLHRNAGPDALPVDPGALQTVAFDTAPTLWLSNNVTTASVFRATFANTPNVDVTGSGVVFTSSDTNIFTVNASGAVLPRAAGTATLSGSFQNRTATTTITVAAPIALRQTVAADLTAGQVVVGAALRADFPTQNDVNVNAFNGITHASSDTNVLTIAANGNITSVAPGTATITSTYGGQTATKSITVALPAGWRRGALVHRYSFDGAPDSTEVTDSVGTAHGELVGVQPGLANNNFNGAGQAALGGGAWNAVPLGAYVNLPNGLVSTLGSVTLESWANTRANTANTRLFDFGMSSGLPDGLGGFGEDAVANPGRSYMFLTPFGGTAPRFAIKTGTAAEVPSITSSLVITQNVNQHFAVVYDQPNGVARLYVNGRRVGTAAATLPLSVVDDRNVWLGRSVWQDPMYNGVIDEFRIYDGAMQDSDVAASYAAGPNALPSNALLTVVVSGANLEITWPATEAGFTLETASALTVPTTWSTVGTAPVVSGSDLKVTIPVGSGNALFRLKK